MWYLKHWLGFWGCKVSIVHLGLVELSQNKFMSIHKQGLALHSS